MYRSRLALEENLSDQKTHAAMKSKLFKEVDHLNFSLYEVELAKAQIDQKEPILMVFFILPNAKL